MTTGGLGGSEEGEPPAWLWLSLFIPTYVASYTIITSIFPLPLLIAHIDDIYQVFFI